MQFYSEETPLLELFGIENLSNVVYVFGCNDAGVHQDNNWTTKMASRRFDAKYGTGEGRTGRAYAIPTRDKNLNMKRLLDIKSSVERFVQYANATPNLFFWVSKVGVEAWGHSEQSLAVLFKEAPSNCYLPEAWSKYMVLEPTASKPSVQRCY